MPELRWTLLIIGVVFLVGLAWWELRRARERTAGGGGLGERQGVHPLAQDAPASAQESMAPARDGIRHEPTISFPEAHSRDALRELPVVEVPDDEVMDDMRIGLRVDGAPEAQDDERPAEEAAEAIVPDSPSQRAPDEVPPLLGVAPPPAPVDPIVEWPDESVRRIIALRLIAPGERFPGRAIRQALTAEGFVLGRLSIFHRPGPDGRAIVSAASLTKPGTFDHESIDMQRYGGLNLFAVLPGPLSPATAFDELLASARNLSERLQGALQDEHGEPLTPMRAAMMREALAGEAEASG